LETRRTLQQRHRGRQAEYLAQSGVEFALAEVLNGRGGEFERTYQPLDDAEVRIRVSPDAQQADVLRVRSSAVTAMSSRFHTAREVVRKYRVVRDADGKATSCVFVGAEF
jgi:hypothetical protein